MRLEIGLRGMGRRNKARVSAEIISKRALLHKETAAVGRLVKPHVFGIFGAKYTGGPVLIGSCVLTAGAGRRFVVTAAHVIDENEWTSLYIGVGGRFVQLDGVRGCATGKPGGSRDRDRIDLAVFEPSPQPLERVPDSSFVAPGDFEVSTNAVAPLYFAVGYPETKSRPVRRRVLRSKGIIFRGAPIDEIKYANPGAQRIFNIVIAFRRGRVVDKTGNLVTAPDPHGMSGGGFWIPTRNAGGHFALKLAGIAIEAPRGKHVLIATRAFIVLEMIRQVCPELAAHLPALPPMKVNIRGLPQPVG